MEKTLINGITLFYEADEKETADILARTCAVCSDLIKQFWGLRQPDNLRVYVMTSWKQFLLHSAPWPYRILQPIFILLRGSRYQQYWDFSAGWTLGYPSRPAVGIKPARLFEIADKTIGLKISTIEKDDVKKVQSVACHELTHAFSAHLRLPMWLNEGLAIVTSEKFLQNPVIRPDTIKMLKADSGVKPKGYREIAAEKNREESIASVIVRGYWFTRYLEEKHPELMKRLLAQCKGEEAMYKEIAAGLGTSEEELFQKLGEMTMKYFGED